MKIGLLGVDDCVLRLAAAAQSRGHEVVACWPGPAGKNSHASALSGVQMLSEWDQLLTVPGLDAVIVAASENDADAEATRMAPLRSLAQAGLSALTCHPVVPSTISHYELDMAREESGGKLVPFSAWRWNPAVARLQELFGSGPLGKLKQVAIERNVADDRRETLQRQFAIDLDLARLLIGDAVRIHAMTTVIPVGDVLSAANNPAKDSNWPDLTIQVVGSSGAAGRWLPQLMNASDRSVARVQATGELGTATLTLWPRRPLGSETSDAAISTHAETRLAWTVGEEMHSETFADNGQIEDAAVADFETAVAGGDSQVTWADACHAMHASESIGRSLKRGRVIDLNYDDYSEEGTFKGLMAAAGCLVLFAALAILGAGILLGGAGWQKFDTIVPVLLLFLLAGFLALQLLGGVFRSKPDDAEQDPASADTRASGPPPTQPMT